MDSILIVGANSLIGGSLCEYLETHGKDVWRTTRRLDEVKGKTVFFDVASDYKSWELPEVSFGAAFICCAVTSIALCESKIHECNAINVDGTLSLAKFFIQRGIFFIFLSSNMVFDGSYAFCQSNDAVNPLTEYGRMKVEVEKALLLQSEKSAIVRLTKVMGEKSSLLKSWIADLREGRKIHPFQNICISPIPLWFVLKVLYLVAENRIAGITQVSASRDITYEDAARYLAISKGLNVSLIDPIIKYGSSEIEQKLYSSLDISRLRNELKMCPPSIYDTILDNI